MAGCSFSPYPKPAARSLARAATPERAVRTFSIAVTAENLAVKGVGAGGLRNT